VGRSKKGIRDSVRDATAFGKVEFCSPEILTRSETGGRSDKKNVSDKAAAKVANHRHSALSTMSKGCGERAKPMSSTKCAASSEAKERVQRKKTIGEKKKDSGGGVIRGQRRGGDRAKGVRRVR